MPLRAKVLTFRASRSSHASSGNLALKTPRLPPITIRISAQEQSIALTTLVSAITSQLGLRPRNAADRVNYKSVQCSLYPFCDGEHQHFAWCDVGDFRDSLMAGIDPPPSPAQVADIAAKRAVIVALNMRPAGGEDADALKQTIKVLKTEFRREKAAWNAVRSRAQQVISARILARLEDDVATGKLVLKRKNEFDYIRLEDLVRWAEYRNVVIEQEMTPLIRLTGTEGVHQHKLAPDLSVNSVVQWPEKPWLIEDPRDSKPAGFQPWYGPARYFARELVRDDSTLLVKREILARKVATSLAAAGFFKRGKGQKSFDAGTVKKALVNVKLG